MAIIMLILIVFSITFCLHLNNGMFDPWGPIPLSAPRSPIEYLGLFFENCDLATRFMASDVFVGTIPRL